MAKPTLVLVPGIWEGPMIYSLVAPKLKEHGFAIVDAPFVSTGTESPGNPSMLDDVKGVRSHIEPLVREDKQVVVVAHSAGGFISAAAVKGLSIKERSAEGLKGGVSKFVFLAAGLGPEGFEHKPLPFMDFQGNRMYCKDPINLLFNDIPSTEAEKWMAQIKWQPAKDWDATVEYAGWKVVPSVYLCGTKDSIIPEPVARHMVEMTGSQLETCDAGHMLPLTQPDVVTEFIRKAAENPL